MIIHIIQAQSGGIFRTSGLVCTLFCGFPKSCMNPAIFLDFLGKLQFQMFCPGRTWVSFLFFIKKVRSPYLRIQCTYILKGQHTFALWVIMTKTFPRELQGQGKPLTILLNLESDYYKMMNTWRREEECGFIRKIHLSQINLRMSVSQSETV